MSIDTTTRKKQYLGNALAINFSIPFPVTIDTVTGLYNLQAIFTDTNDVDTVIPYANFEITTTVPPSPTNPYPPMSVKYPLSGEPIATGTKITFYRVTPITQGVDLTNAGSFHATTLEMQGFDYSRIIDQEIAEDVKRAIKLPITSDKTEEEFTKELFDAKDQAVESAAEALVSEQNAKASEEAAAQTLIDVNNAGATQVGIIVAQGEVTKNEVIDEGTIQIGLATDQAVIAAEQAAISTAKAGESANSADLAELWAIGTIIAQPLGSAKHYAELAAESALSIIDAVIFKGRVDDLAALPDINDPTTLNGWLYYVGLANSAFYSEYVSDKTVSPPVWLHVGNTGLQDGLTLIVFNSTTGIGYTVNGLHVSFTSSTVPVIIIAPNNDQYAISNAVSTADGHFTIDMTAYILDQQQSMIVGEWRCFFGNALGSVIDSALSITSDNTVKNSVITLAIEAVSDKADANTAGLSTTNTNVATNATDIGNNTTSIATSYKKGYILEHKVFMEQTPFEGWAVTNGALLNNADTLYPLAWAELQKTENAWKLKTEAEWQALSTITRKTGVDSAGADIMTPIWDGIGGVTFYVLNTTAKTIRLPDTRKMHTASASTENPVGTVQGDAIRNLTGTAGSDPGYGIFSLNTASGCFTVISSGTHGPIGSHYSSMILGFDASGNVPTAPKNTPDTMYALHCVYLGKPQI